MLYLIIPLMILLSLLFPYVPIRLLVALEIVTLGELTIVNFLRKITPEHGSRRAGKRPAIFGFGARQARLRYCAVVLALAILSQWLLLSWSSPLALKGVLQQAAVGNQGCAAQETLAD